MASEPVSLIESSLPNCNSSGVPKALSISTWLKDPTPMLRRPRRASPADPGTRSLDWGRGHAPLRQNGMSPLGEILVIGCSAGRASPSVGYEAGEACPIAGRGSSLTVERGGISRRLLLPSGRRDCLRVIHKPPCGSGNPLAGQATGLAMTAHLGWDVVLGAGSRCMGAGAPWSA